jgi:hypothetical protein
VASEDALVTAFAAEAGIEPEEVEKARRTLGSGDQASGIRDQE